MLENAKGFSIIGGVTAAVEGEAEVGGGKVYSGEELRSDVLERFLVEGGP